MTFARPLALLLRGLSVAALGCGTSTPSSPAPVAADGGATQGDAAEGGATPGACSTMPAPTGPNVIGKTGASKPATTGGTIPDGTYVLTAINVYGAVTETPVESPEALRFTGNVLEWSIISQTTNKPLVQKYHYAAQGPNLSLTWVCNEGDLIEMSNRSWTYTIANGALTVILDPSLGWAAVFTSQ